MNCERFDDRLNGVLDQQGSIDADTWLQMHAAQCESCRQKLVVWRQVDFLLAKPAPARAVRVTPKIWPAVAAAMLVACCVIPWHFVSRRSVARWTNAGPSPLASSATESTPLRPLLPSESPGFAIDRSPVDQASNSVDRRLGNRLGNQGDSPIEDRSAVEVKPWWRSVEPGQWIADTMPTVRTVQQSVAPLGRSFRQAVNLLTFGGAT